MSIELNPQRLIGPWNSGYALHVHALSSTYLGDDEYGHPRFSTTRSPVGELLYQLKYRNDRTAIMVLGDAAAQFCKNNWQLKVHAIVPVPPTQSRRLQPVLAVAEALAAKLRVPMCKGLRKIKRTPQLKDLADYHERMEALQYAFSVDSRETEGRQLLLFDDLYGSGATVRTITKALFTQGRARAVYLLTLIKKASG